MIGESVRKAALFSLHVCIAVASLLVASGLCDIAVGDLNGDGRPDVVLVTKKTDQISIFLQK